MRRGGRAGGGDLRRGIGGSTHQLVRDDHVFVCLCSDPIVLLGPRFVGEVNMHLARCRLFMG